MCDEREGETTMTTYHFDEASAFYGPIAQLPDNVARIFFELVCMSKPNAITLSRIKGRPIDEEVKELHHWGLITLGTNGNVEILKIALKTNSSERVKKYREIKKLEKNDENVSAPRDDKSVNVSTNPAPEEADPWANEPNDAPKRVKIAKAQPAIPFESIMQLWNEKAVLIPKCAALTAPRKSAMKGRWEEASKMIESKDHQGLLAFFSRYFDRINSNRFMTGNNDRGWRASFDWAFTPRAFVRIMERTY